MQKLKILGVIGLIFLTAGCRAWFAPNSATKDITSADGKFRITVPGDWVQETTLNKVYNIHASSSGFGMWVMVISTPKEDLSDMTLEENSKLSRERLLKNLKDPQLSEPKTLTIAGYPALRYEIRGGLKLSNAVYLHTTVETPKYFHHIVAWTFPSRLDQDRATLEKVVETFREVTPGPMLSRSLVFSSTPNPAPR